MILSRKAFSLLSGGLDSTVVLYRAMDDFKGQVEAISIDYGQRHKKEIEYAAATCNRLNIGHTVLSLGDILKGSMLTDTSIAIPNKTYAQLPEGVSPTYVPFRNGLMLSMIAAKAQQWINGADTNEQRQAGIYFGAHAEDADNWAYPDCTPEFIGAMANAIFIGTYQAVRLHTPVMWMRKSEIVTMGKALSVPFENTWSCYAGGEDHCGKCPTCYARQQAFIMAEVPDPTVYAENLSNR
jgi:7-cyano-7-deazaguanine synthase